MRTAPLGRGIHHLLRVSSCANRALLSLQARAQFILGETYVEELRLAETPTFPAGSGEVLDPRTMGIATAACTSEISPGVAGAI